MHPITQPEPNSIEEQLHALYVEKEYLQEHLGVSDADLIVALVKNLEAQISELHQNQIKPETT
jgi:hypothetical protein